MALRAQIDEALRAFLVETNFTGAGALITDLDGTAMQV